MAPCRGRRRGRAEMRKETRKEEEGIKCSEGRAGHLDQMWGVLSVQRVLRQLVPVGHPGVSQHLSRRQPTVGVHVEHLGDQVLTGATHTHNQNKGKIHSSNRCGELLVPHLGLIGHRGPVSSSQGELPTADASQNLLRCVVRAIGKRGEAAGGQDCESTL